MRDLLASHSIFRDPPRIKLPLSGPHDGPILAILDAPLGLAETAHDGYRRKEHELGAAFAALPIVEARALHARLAAPRAGDAVAERFQRLVGDRRVRLLAFLADARRRAALAGGL
jgi:hypothetical protein